MTAPTTSPNATQSRSTGAGNQPGPECQHDARIDGLHPMHLDGTRVGRNPGARQPRIAPRRCRCRTTDSCAHTNMVVRSSDRLTYHISGGSTESGAEVYVRVTTHAGVAVRELRCRQYQAAKARSRWSTTSAHHSTQFRSVVSTLAKPAQSTPTPATETSSTEPASQHPTLADATPSPTTASRPFAHQPRRAHGNLPLNSNQPRDGHPAGPRTHHAAVGLTRVTRPPTPVLSTTGAPVGPGQAAFTVLGNLDPSER